jgi:hypothetical protein
MQPLNKRRLLWACLAALYLSVFYQAGAAVGTNSQDGDNVSTTEQAGESASGDAVAGQVFGGVANGDVQADASNRSRDVDVSSGDSAGSNNNSGFVGQLSVVEGDPEIASANSQTGDNEAFADQRADASSGDAVGGQVIGVVTPAGGSADLVAANTTEDSDISSGGAEAVNDSGVFAGLLAIGETGEVSLSAITTLNDEGVGNRVIQTTVLSVAPAAANTQDGTNDSDVVQAASAVSGDGVGGQILGIVSAGSASIDATNRSSAVDVATGDATSANTSEVFAGLLVDGEVDDVIISLINELEITGDSNTVVQTMNLTLGGAAANDQDGDNDSTTVQNAGAVSGDGVGGQVLGIVTSSGGSADVVAANNSENVDAQSGDAQSINDTEAFVGASAIGETVGDLNFAFAFDTNIGGDDNTVLISLDATLLTGATNTQKGDNGADLAQSTSAASGDAIAGQILGLVSAGDSAIDATNRSSDVDATSGNANSAAFSDVFAGLLIEGDTFVVGDDVDETLAFEILEGMDGNLVQIPIIITFDFGSDSQIHNGDIRSDVAQSPIASSGDAVAGQVIGAVTAPGGTSDIAVANSSVSVDLLTGNSTQASVTDSFVGLRADVATLVA